MKKYLIVFLLLPFLFGFTHWKLPDGSLVRKSVSERIKINGSYYYSISLERMRDAGREAIGVKQWKEVPYDQKYYRSTGYTDIVDGNHVIRTHTITEKYSLADLKELIIDKIVDAARACMINKRLDLYTIHKAFNVGYTIPSEKVTQETNIWDTSVTHITAINACGTYQCVIDYENTINWPNGE